MQNLTKQIILPILGLLTGAIVWGLIWYPYRYLESLGTSGTFATFFTFAFAFVVGLVLFIRDICSNWQRLHKLLFIALAAGWANLAYVIAMMDGQVMRVLLLFYLSPLWTILFSRILLKEKPGAIGLLVIILSLSGAVIMLWRPNAGLPLPQNSAEWIALSSGLAFALSNVLIRKNQQYSVPLKSLSAWFGVSILALALMIMQQDNQDILSSVSYEAWLMLLLLGIVIFSVNIAVQHGLTHVPANRAIVIFLLELVVGAISSYFLAQETIGIREYVAAGMVIIASLLSGKVSPSEKDRFA